MKNWAFVLGAAAATATAIVVVSLAYRRASYPDDLDDVPRILEDCHDRILRIEKDLQRLKPLPDSVH